jgi:hypothetical protein
MVDPENKSPPDVKQNSDAVDQVIRAQGAAPPAAPPAKSN